MSRTIQVIPRGSISASVIRAISKEQQRTYRVICKALHLRKSGKPIRVEVFSSRTLMHMHTGFHGNAFADQQRNTIYAYVPKNRRALGYHEMVHVLSEKFGKAPLFYVEGLAVYFDKTWHGEPLEKVIRKEYSLVQKQFLCNLLSDKKFRSAPQKLAYAFSGLAFRLLVKQHGLQTVLNAYRHSRGTYAYSRNKQTFEKYFAQPSEDFFMELLQRLLK